MSAEVRRTVQRSGATAVRTPHRFVLVLLIWPGTARAAMGLYFSVFYSSVGINDVQSPGKARALPEDFGGSQLSSTILGGIASPTSTTRLPIKTCLKKVA